jgi:hypothetical protein
MEIRTAQYQFSHGSLPRGRGNWVFQFVIGIGRCQVLFAPAGLLYSEAKRWALKQADVLRAFDITVLP